MEEGLLIGLEAWGVRAIAHISRLNSIQCSDSVSGLCTGLFAFARICADAYFVSQCTEIGKPNGDNMQVKPLRNSDGDRRRQKRQMRKMTAAGKCNSPARQWAG